MSKIVNKNRRNFHCVYFYWISQYAKTEFIPSLNLFNAFHNCLLAVCDNLHKVYS